VSSIYHLKAQGGQRVSPTDDTLRRTAAAAKLYQVPEPMIAAPTGALTRIPEEWRRQGAQDALVDAVVRVAESHQPCPGECGTCQAVRSGLGVTLGVVRVEVNVEFEQKIE